MACWPWLHLLMPCSPSTCWLTRTLNPNPNPNPNPDPNQHLPAHRHALRSRPQRPRGRRPAPQLTRTPRRLRRVRTGYAYQPPALGTYRRRRAACPQGATFCTCWVRVPAKGVPYVPRTVAPQSLRFAGYHPRPAQAARRRRHPLWQAALRRVPLGLRRLVRGRGWLGGRHQGQAARQVVALPYYLGPLVVVRTRFRLVKIVGQSCGWAVYCPCFTKK